MPGPVGTWTPRADPLVGLRGMLGSALSGASRGLSARAGTFPGAFAPSQSFYDRLQGLQYQQEMARAMQVAAFGDTAFYMQFARGLTSLAGTPYGPAQHMAASRVARDLAAAGPTIAQMMPMTFDALHGQRGSAQVMAMNVFDAGRFLRNNVTGGMGLSGQQAGELSRGLHAELFGPRGSAGSPADQANLRLMNGLGAGQSGQMFSQMVQRGMIGSAGGGAADVQSISRRMREMSGAVRAMQDIFGDMGQPDAPMRQIFETLNRVTQGGLVNMNPTTMRNTVRRLHALSHQTGMGFEAMAGMVQAGGQMAQSAGLHRSFGVATAQSSAAFGQAWANLAGNQGFGGLSRGEATQLDQRLRTSAAASAQGNALGAVANMAEQGLLSGVNTPQQISQLIGQMGGMDRSQMTRVLQSRFGVSGATVSRFMMSREANQGAGLRHGTADVVRGQQWREVSRMMDNALSAGAGGGRLGAAVGPILRHAIMTMDPDLLNNPERVRERNQALGQALQAAGINMPPAQLQELVARAFTSLDQRVRSHPALGQFGNVGGLVSMNRGDVVQQGAANIAAADRAGQAASATAGLGQSGFISRVVDAVAESRGAETGGLAGVMSRAAGGIPMDRIRSAVGPDAERMIREISGMATSGRGGPMRIEGTLELRDGRAEIRAHPLPGGVPPPGG